MKDDKFTVIDEIKLGPLNETMRLEWDRLYAEQLTLMRRQAAHEEAMSEFWNALERTFKDAATVHDADPSFRVSPEGDVFLNLCKCPVCQARVHGMSVLETVEEMYKNELIGARLIDHVRQQAAAVDTKREISKKMLN